MGAMELSQRLDFGSFEAVAPDPEDTFAELASLVDDHFDITPSPDTPLADTGLTSLDRVELAIRIEERFGVRVDESVYDACATAGDLANYIEERAQ